MTKLTRLTIVLAVVAASAAPLFGQCAGITINAGITPDGTQVYATAQLTDNYVDANYACAPGWISNGCGANGPVCLVPMTHTYTLTVTITSPSGRVASATADASASNG